MHPVLASFARAHGDWLFLQILRAAVLAAVVGVGAAAIRNVTAALEYAVYGSAAPRASVHVPPAAPCGGVASRPGCRAIQASPAPAAGPV